MARRIHSPEAVTAGVQARAVELLSTSGRPLAQIARELGVSTESSASGAAGGDRRRQARGAARAAAMRGCAAPGAGDPEKAAAFAAESETRCSASALSRRTRRPFPISLLCRVLGVSRSGFHARERRSPSARALADAWLAERQRASHPRAREQACKVCPCQQEASVVSDGDMATVHEPSTRLSSPVTSSPLQSTEPPSGRGLG
jgi:hypothetical protein